jgi:hypothetical protein
MTRHEAFKSGYLSQDDLPNPVITTIKAAGKEMMSTDDNGQREKPVIYFSDRTKPLVLNMVNWDTIEAAYGTDSEGWLGKPIELFVDRNVMYGAKKVGGIRIRIPAGDSSPINFEKAQALAREVGSSREELIAFLQKNGRQGYSAARDSQLVREFIKSKQPQHAGVGDDDIPF